VTRHAPAARTTLQVTRDESQLTITVTDNGSGAEPPDNAGQPGLGIAGMRERALLHGGEFRAGPRPSGGFEVVAVFPAERSHGPADTGDGAA
jgi:signal transduction histidine kinase